MGGNRNRSRDALRLLEGHTLRTSSLIAAFIFAIATGMNACGEEHASNVPCIVLTRMDGNVEDPTAGYVRTELGPKCATLPIAEIASRDLRGAFIAACFTNAPTELTSDAVRRLKAAIDAGSWLIACAGGLVILDSLGLGTFKDTSLSPVDSIIRNVFTTDFDHPLFLGLPRTHDDSTFDRPQRIFAAAGSLGPLTASRWSSVRRNWLLPYVTEHLTPRWPFQTGRTLECISRFVGLCTGERELRTENIDFWIQEQENYVIAVPIPLGEQRRASLGPVLGHLLRNAYNWSARPR